MKSKNSAYLTLTRDLNAILQAGQINALQQLQEIRAQTYWQMGRRLAQIPEIKKAKSLPPLWMERLLRDLTLSRSQLSRILKFYFTYPKGLPKMHRKKPLSWGAHVALLPLQDETERSFYLQKAIEQGWGVQQLRDALKQKLYQTNLLITGSPSKKKQVRLQRPTTGLYLYQAVVERVIDGDTLLVNLDLGFDVWKKQRLRLRAIDCAELKTKPGQEAKAFVERRLSATELVILKTYKMDLHGRFVCDVFFKPGESDKQKVFQEGIFLNELLVEHQHAIVV